MKNWFSFLALGLVSAFVCAEEVMVTADRVNLRAAPNGNAEVVGQVSYEERLTLQGDLSEPWVKVGIPPRFNVWVRSDLIRDGKIIVNRALMRAGAGLNYNVVGELERGTMLEVRGSFGDWTKVAPHPQCWVYITNCYVTALAPAAPAAEPATGATPVPSPPVAPPPAPAPAEPAPPVAESLEPAPVPPVSAEPLISLPPPATNAISAPAVPADPPSDMLAIPATAPAPENIEVAPKLVDELPASPAPTTDVTLNARPPRRTLFGGRSKDSSSVSEGLANTTPAARSTLLSSNGKTPVGPAKIPANRLRSKTEQGLPGVYAGELVTSPLTGMHPTRFRLVSYDADHVAKTVAYVYGNSRQLQSMKGDTMTISGAVYWFKETDLPTIYAQDILRGKAEK